MNSTPAHASKVANLEAAREIGFGQCVRALCRVLMTTPVGVSSRWIGASLSPKTLLPIKSRSLLLAADDMDVTTSTCTTLSLSLKG